MDERQTTTVNPAARAFALAAVLGDGAESAALMRHLPPVLASDAEREIQSLLALAAEERIAIIKARLRRLDHQRHSVSLGVVHPSWILEAIKQESPLVRGLVLRYLPAEGVAVILTRMDPKERDHLPSMKFSFRVAPEIVSFIRSELEGRIGPVEPPLDLIEGEGHGPVAALFQWDYRRLASLMPELGLELLAVALRGTESERVRFFLKRLSTSDASRLKHRIRAHRDVEAKLTQSALVHVLSLDLAAGQPNVIFPEAGVSLLALPFRGLNVALARIFAKRMEPQWGYLFLRYVQETRDLSLADGGRLAAHVLERIGHE